MLKKLLIFPILITTFSLGCQLLADKTKTTGSSNTPVETRSQPADNANAAKSPENVSSQPVKEPPSEEKDLLSFFSGALIVKKTGEYSGWTAENMIDENPSSGWASPKDQIANHSFAIELPEKTLLKTLSFDVASADGENREAKDITVEISEAGADTGFQEIARVSIKGKTDNQRFKVDKEIPGRFVRVSFGQNQGSTEYIELMEIRGFGEQMTKTPIGNVSGVYKTDFGDFHIKQEGTSIIGCYEHDGGLLKGGVEDHVMKLTWQESGGPNDSGPAVMVFTADGQKMVGLWWTVGSDILTNRGNQWNGTKKSSEVGSCPQLPDLSKPNAVQTQIANDLKQKGRATVYGINFDTGSDAIKPESKQTLDQITALLKENAAWRMTIEGHTDNVGGADDNQKLSEKRAASVKDYLVKAGIEAARLNSTGFGISKPVAANDSALGRAQNRRVELVKN